MRLTPTKVYLQTGVNLSLAGEDGVNLGSYTSKFFLDSDTDITYRELSERVRRETNFQLPEIPSRSKLRGFTVRETNAKIG